MKQIIVKLVIFLPILLFIDWIIMIVVGCASNFCGANTVFFFSYYYYFGILLIFITSLFLLVIVLNPHIHQRSGDIIL
jgi:hypothetical protein